jgi:hypothetical protein
VNNNYVNPIRNLQKKNWEYQLRGVQEPRWSNFLHRKLFFPHVVSCDEIALREILLLDVLS